ncbi:PTS sugar transporter subunit IIA [Collinsella sp. AGMB00827]|uniref:PTS sugar transporter subunit IIA n=1 Tax=Collinsella ureilytica TaxID=2869515 RepID=A0ABS7MMV0_9ACTN|nr:PTS sugar transporter subunit IIA [Collinsella urealyticum]MBY4797750.1 PTS sugar transporter subunit IIA [Collinsella urealyticum]
MSAVDIDLFKPELVFFDFEAKDRAEFFQKLAVELSTRGYIKDTWLDAIVQREREYPTGLACQAMSVAIPHTDPEHLQKPYIAVIKPQHPITFEAMAHMGDDVSAELIVNLGLLAHADEQVAVLQALMGMFMDEAASREILEQTTPEGMVEVMCRRCQA